MWKTIVSILLVMASYALGLSIGWGIGYQKALKDQANNKVMQGVLEK